MNAPLQPTVASPSSPSPFQLWLLPLHVTLLLNTDGIEKLWKIDSIIIQSITGKEKKKVLLFPMLFEVQMVCASL